jgi:hypothetical protein
MLVPGAVDDVEAVSRLADDGLATQNQWQIRWNQCHKALLEYRFGRFASAVKWVSKSQEDEFSFYLEAYNDLLLAMAYHRLGQATDARHWMKKARQVMATRFPQIGNGRVTNLPWNEWLQCHILRREAEALLGQTGAPQVGHKGGGENPGKRD